MSSYQASSALQSCRGTFRRRDENVLDAMRRWAIAFLALAAASGCQGAMYFIRETSEPMKAIEVRADRSERRSCLVVLVPGLYDLPDHFFEHGFVRDALRASDRCDLVAVDAHVGYYQNGIIQERLGGDILRIAEGRGYREVWMVGISMGALGTLLVAREHEHLVRGVVLIAPWLGDEAMVASARRAGGLERWRAPRIEGPPSMSSATSAALTWLSGYASHPDRMPELHVAVGREDRLAPMSAMIGEVIPRERYHVEPGVHNWASWSALWQHLLRDPPWDRGVAEAEAAIEDASPRCTPLSVCRLLFCRRRCPWMKTNAPNDRLRAD